MTHDEDHDRGLAFDLQTISRQMATRRKALFWLGGAGTATLLAGCGGGDSGTTTTVGSSTATAATDTSSTTNTSTSTGTTTTGSCIADPSETSGPYPADGTNISSGATSNVLTASGIVRSDVRSSFLTSSTVAQGVQTTLTLTLVNASDNCTPLSGYAIYVWNADNNGHYSLYTEPTESYLRGVQVTESNGQVTFVTNFPACYDGRYPHVHFEVYQTISTATSGKAALLTSQLAMPASVCSTVYADTSLYPDSASKFASVSLSTDMVFGDNTSAQIAQQTPTMTGSVSAGYVATATIGIAV